MKRATGCWVYQLENLTRGELYIFAAPRPVAAVSRARGAREVSHWKARDVLELRSLGAVPRGYIPRLMDLYAAQLRRSGLRVILGRAPALTRGRGKLS